MDAAMIGFLVQAVAGRGLYCRINWGWKCRFGNDEHILFNCLPPIDLSYAHQRRKYKVIGEMTNEKLKLRTQKHKKARHSEILEERQKNEKWLDLLVGVSFLFGKLL